MSEPASAVSPATAAAEQRIRAALAQQKWRQARNDLKSLVKTDPARFLPLLIEANLGLAHQMLADGQIAQARQVREYLATIASAEQVRTIDAQLAARSGGSGGAEPAVGALAALADPVAPLPEAQRIQHADRIVLAFEPVTAAEPAHARFADEARAIHDALQAVSDRAWALASETLRRVPHRSPFSHWAAFVKGIVAFHAGESDRATRLLQGLPADSVPSKAARAYLCLLAEASAPTVGNTPATFTPPSEPLLAAVCRLRNAGNVSGVLLRADRLWRDGKHVESYRAVRDGVPHFPSAGLDWQGVLSEFYFKAPHGMPPDDWMAFLRFFCDAIERNRWKTPAEAMLALRMICLMGQGVAPADELRSEWLAFLRQHQAIRGENSRFASRAYAWLGEQLAATPRADGFFSGRPQLRDAKGAVEMLQRSIELDPTNLTAHLALCQVHGALNQRSERNRLLDLMTARFPDDKQVLVRAAEGCIERKAFGKALDYLTRARQLDQLDPRIPELTVAALCAQATQQFQQHRPEKARQTLAQTEAWLSDQPEDLRRSRWMVLVRRGLLERRWGDAAESAVLLAQARERAPNVAVMLLYAHLVERTHARSHFSETPFLTELKKTLRRAARLSEIVLLLRLLQGWQETSDESRTQIENEAIAVGVGRALEQPFTRAEVAELFDRARDIFEFVAPLGKLLKKILRTDPADPQARLWQLEFDGLSAFDAVACLPHLQSIAAEAARRHDEPTLRKARQLLREADFPPPDPFIVDPADLDLDEDDDFEPDPDSPFPLDLPPEIAAEFGSLVEAMRVAPESALRELRKTARRQGMPDIIFETLVAAAKGRPLPPLPPGAPGFPSRPSPGKPKPPPPSDPNQTNLF